MTIVESNAEHLQLVVDNSQGTMVMAAAGDIDLCTAPLIGRQVLRVLDGGTKDIVIDLRGVEFLDSIGISVLVGAWRRARSRAADVRLVCPAGRIRTVLDITGLNRVMTVHETLEGALDQGLARE